MHQILQTNPAKKQMKSSDKLDLKNMSYSSSKPSKYSSRHARSCKSSLKQLHMQKHPKVTQNASFMHFLNSGKLQIL